MKFKKLGKIILISGPSGVGKGTICEKLLQLKELNLSLSISATTRKPRENEIDGINYFFLNKKEFEDKIKNNEFLEYAIFNNNYYGTPKKYCNKEIRNGKNILLEIETKGAKQIFKNNLDIISIFLLPPSFNELKKRIIKRNVNSLESINKRIKIAENEIKAAKFYKFQVVNNNLKQCINQIINIIKNQIYN